MTNTKNTPIEALERAYPMRVLRYRLRRGSGGAGWSLGGEGIERDLLMLEDVIVSLITERRVSQPWVWPAASPARWARTGLCLAATSRGPSDFPTSARSVSPRATSFACSPLGAVAGDAGRPQRGRRVSEVMLDDPSACAASLTSFLEGLDPQP